ncbi:MAG: DUF2807 domain-containing protein [Bacteroidales bacterium]|nr:DUF2807 domain-containing protein [Bacteroidales bacterium]
MKHTVTLFVFLFVGFHSFAQQKISRNIENFHSLDAFGNLKIELRRSDSTKIILKADVYDISKVKTIVEQGVLKIKSNGIGDKNEVMVIVYFKDLKDITIDGGTNIFKTDTLKANDLYIKVLKGSLMSSKINCKNLIITANSGGEARLYGKTKTINAVANTGGLVDLATISAKEADLTAISGGKINVTVTEKLTARAKMKGVISYKGNPKTESVEPVSGGRIIKL